MAEFAFAAVALRAVFVFAQILHFEQLWKRRSWLAEPGNLGICKVSTITKAINLDTIMQSREREGGVMAEKQKKLRGIVQEQGKKKEIKRWQACWWDDGWSLQWGFQRWGPRPLYLRCVYDKWQPPLCCVRASWPTNSRLMTMAKTYGNGAPQNSAISDTSGARGCDSSELHTHLYI